MDLCVFFITSETSIADGYPFRLLHIRQKVCITRDVERSDPEVLHSISIRSGKAFWSRGMLNATVSAIRQLIYLSFKGPGLCFQRTHCGAVPSASETFPSLRAVPGHQDDFSAMLQA